MKTRFLFTTVNRFDNPVSFQGEVEHDVSAQDTDILEIIFSLCNRGSGRTMEEFETCGVPSLSVGNIVMLVSNRVGRYYMCDGSGWSLVAPK